MLDRKALILHYQYQTVLNLGEFPFNYPSVSLDTTACVTMWSFNGTNCPSRTDCM